ncbi:hypothetical protein [Methylocystis sp.]|uniref:hypothetical protein n=1 Tax=Methylocystis sp. TaxID=1911079 RepID=UPI003DA5B922
MMFSTTQKLLATTTAISLVGCGLHTPDYQEPWEGDHGAATRMVFEISKRVRCDLKDALQKLVFGRENRGDVNKHELDWLKTWGVQVVLTLTIAEKSTFSPGVSFITP